MAPLVAVVHEDGTSLNDVLLEAGSHLPDVRGIAAVILIAGDEEHGRVIDTTVYAMVGRVGVKGVEVFYFIDSPVFLPPLNRLIDLPIPHPFQYPSNTEHHPDEIKPF